MGPISYSVTLHEAKKASSAKHSSLVGPFLTQEEKEVLWIQHHDPNLRMEHLGKDLKAHLR